MNFLLLISLCVTANAAPYLWDLLKAPLTAEEVQTILSSKSEGDWPTYNSIPATNFDCRSKQQGGFYADQDTKCQVFHRCDINGNLTSYLCANTTVFNQLTLVCDYFYNVDCQRSKEFENFANSRLYTTQDLFDTPPANYIMPDSLVFGFAREGLLPTTTVRTGNLGPNVPDTTTKVLEIRTASTSGSGKKARL